jgi:hypothetical protein
MLNDEEIFLKHYYGPKGKVKNYSKPYRDASVLFKSQNLAFTLEYNIK